MSKVSNQPAVQSADSIIERISKVANDSYQHSRSIMPEQPWWNNLEPMFYKFPDGFELDLHTDLQVGATVQADLLVRTGAASLAAASALGYALNPASLKEDYQRWGAYQALADTHDVAQVFRPPVRKVDIQEKKTRFDFRPESGESVDLFFDSPYVPFHDELKARYLKNRRNLKARARYWRHDGEPRPTLIVVHGFMADPYWLNAKFLALPWFYKQGFNVLLYTMPFHGSRQERTSVFSGQHFFSRGIGMINEAMMHAVHDLRIFMDYLLEQGVPKMGMTGISLGGYTTSLMACVDDRLSFAIPNVPLASVIDIAMQWFPASMLISAGMKVSGVSIREVRHALALHSPLTYQPKLPKERLLIIGGAGDRMAPPKHSRLLWEHWDRCALHWFPGNHVIHLDQGKYLKDMLRFMHQCGF